MSDKKMFMTKPTNDDPNTEETIQQLVVSQGGFFVREVKKPDDLCAASAAPTQPRIMRLATIEEIRKHLAPLLAEYEKQNKGGEKVTDDKTIENDIDFMSIAMANIANAIECLEKVHSVELINQMNSLDEVCTDLRFERKQLSDELEKNNGRLKRN